MIQSCKRGSITCKHTFKWNFLLCAQDGEVEEEEDDGNGDGDDGD